MRVRPGSAVAASGHRGSPERKRGRRRKVQSLLSCGMLLSCRITMLDLDLSTSRSPYHQSSTLHTISLCSLGSSSTGLSLLNPDCGEYVIEPSKSHRSTLTSSPPLPQAPQSRVPLGKVARATKSRRRGNQIKPLAHPPREEIADMHNHISILIVATLLPTGFQISTFFTPYRYAR